MKKYIKSATNNWWPITSHSYVMLKAYINSFYNFFFTSLKFFGITEKRIQLTQNKIKLLHKSTSINAHCWTTLIFDHTWEGNLRTFSRRWLDSYRCNSNFIFIIVEWYDCILNMNGRGFFFIQIENCCQIQYWVWLLKFHV